MNSNRTDVVVGLILIIILLYSLIGTKRVEYKVDVVSATSTETLSVYLNRMGKDGWDIFNYTDFVDGRQYIFKK